jgi:hypothetical protein
MIENIVENVEAEEINEYQSRIWERQTNGKGTMERKGEKIQQTPLI